MKPRYYPRAFVSSPASFTLGKRSGEGRTLNVTVPGCQIDSALPPTKGDCLTLRLDLQELGTTFHIPLGIVRWVKGTRFGVEFIQMNQKDRARYNARVSQFIKKQALNRSRLGRKACRPTQGTAISGHGNRCSTS
ncbi:PilZ domain-containing protein [Petrachloros mirabilis]